MRNFFGAIYGFIRGVIKIIFLFLWASSFIEFLKEGDIGGAIIWIAVGFLFYLILFRLIFRNRKRRRTYYRSSGGNSGGGDYDFWDSSDSGSSDGGGGDGGGGGD